MPGSIGNGDIYVRDRQARATSRVNVSRTGQIADAGGLRGRISADARVVCFTSHEQLVADLQP